MEENKKLRTKIGKLLSSNRKPGEGFAEVFAVEPKDFLEKQHGNMYFVVEVASGSKAAIDVGEAIINAVRDEYYDDLNRSVILSLESALRKANEELSDFASMGETDWVGKLNVVCAIISEEKLHLAKVGATEAYILRGSKMTQISEGASLDEEADHHPLKTFSTITSGKLYHGDKIILSTSELLTHISLTGIKKIVQENKPHDAMVKLREILKNEEGIGSIGTLIVEMVTEDEMALETEDIGDEIWIEEKEPNQGAKEIGSALLASLIAFFSNLPKVFKTKVAPKAKDIFQQAKEAVGGSKSGKNISEKDNQKTETEKETAQSPADRESSKNKSKKDETFISFVLNYFKNFKLDRFIADIKKVFGKMGKFIKEKSKNKNFKFLMAGLVVVLLVIILLFVNFQRTKNMNLAEAKYNEALELYEKGQNALIYDAKNEASGYLNESRALAEDILNTRYFKNEALELVAKIDKALKEANGIYEVSGNLVFELSGSAEQVVIKNKILYTLDSDNKKVYTYDIEKKKSEEVNLNTNFRPKQMAAFENLNTIVIYTEGPEILELSTRTNNVDKRSTSGGFKRADILATYLSNIYLLSRENNQIYRHTGGLTYGASVNYINDKTVDVTNAVSVAIPGTVMVLHENGQVTKLSRGKKIEFSLSLLPFKIEEPAKIINNPESNRIYILDKQNGIISFKLDGSYLKTYQLKDKKQIKDFQVDEDSNVIYALVDNQVLSFGL